MTVPSYMTDPDYVGCRPPPPGDWWVVVVGTRKSQDSQGNVVGQEAAKLRQLRILGQSISYLFSHLCTQSSTNNSIYLRLFSAAYPLQ